MKKIVLSIAVIATMGLASCGGTSLCECVNLDEDKADEKMLEECKTMKTDWKAKFKDASEEEQKTMQAEIEACEKEKEESGSEEESAH